MVIAVAKLISHIAHSSFTADIDDSEDGQIIVGAKYGYATLNRQTGKLKYLKKIWADAEGSEKEKRLVLLATLRDVSIRRCVKAVK